MPKPTLNLFYCITLAFIGVLKHVDDDVGNAINCITLAFIGVLKPVEIFYIIIKNCITLAFIGVLKRYTKLSFTTSILYHIGVYRGIKTIELK